MKNIYRLMRSHFVAEGSSDAPIPVHELLRSGYRFGVLATATGALVVTILSGTFLLSTNNQRSLFDKLVVQRRDLRELRDSLDKISYSEGIRNFREHNARLVELIQLYPRSSIRSHVLAELNEIKTTSDRLDPQLSSQTILTTSPKEHLYAAVKDTQQTLDQFSVEVYSESAHYFSLILFLTGSSLAFALLVFSRYLCNPIIRHVTRHLDDQQHLLGNAAETIEALQSFLESSALMIAVLELTDTETRFLSYNDRFAQLFGLTPHRAGTTLSLEALSLPSETNELILRQVRESQTLEATVKFEHNFFHLRDCPWLSISIHRHTEKASQPSLKFVLFLEEITQRKRSEEKLRDHEARLRAMNDASPTGIFVADKRGRAIYLNHELRRMLGCGRGDGLNTSWTKFLAKADRRTLLERVRLWRPNQPLLPHTHRIFQDDGSTLWASTRVAPIRDGDEVRGYIATVEDRTVQKEIEEQLCQQTEAAQAATKAKSSFLANMSHEIRTPLTSIIGFSESILAGDLKDEEQEEALRLIIRSSHHLKRIINDILDLSKIEAGKMELEHVQVPLADLLYELEHLVKPQAREKGLDLQVHIKLPLPRIISTDPTRFKQIFINLLSNGIKFSKEGVVKLDVRFDRTKNLLTLEVEDSGIGMTEEQQRKLFQAFSQGDASTTRKFGGTGLGLLISKELCSRLGGTISVQSMLGKGSIFTVNLPVDTTLAEDLTTDLSVTETISQSVTQTPSLTGKVLIIEDGIENQQILSLLLRKTGLQVTIQENGLLGLESVRREHFDLILLDMHMPVMDGLTAAPLIREAGYAGPLVALTAYSTQESIQASLKAGCSDFLAKPFERSIFMSRLAHWLGQKDQSLLIAPTHLPDISLTTLLREEPDIADLVLRFLDSLPERLALLDEALSRKDYGQAMQEAHRLKGISGTYGYTIFSQVCGDIELAIRNKEEHRLPLLLGNLKAQMPAVSETRHYVEQFTNTASVEANRMS